MLLSRRKAIIGIGAGTASLLGLSACSHIGNENMARIAPFGATPSNRHLAWHDLETYGFVHFSMNTFTDREWGYGDEHPSLFNPTDFSARQIVDSAKAGGLRGLILTAKHHDGFCLWPSQYTEHSVKNCPYKGGKGDIVGELSKACAKAGLKFGVYLSPWDRNHAEYGRPAYVAYYHNQLEELTTGYGPLFEVWFDGANGGDGYYGGARERRKIEAATYYQWDKIREIVRRNQPDAVMFADEHMDVRWVGNEKGVAGDPCWPTVDETPYTMPKGNKGVRGGHIWNPAETNTSIRPGWFWHADENDKVRSPANLLRLYMTSVGRGTNLLLNLPPDRRGRIHEADVASLTGFKAILDQAYSADLAEGAIVFASSTFGRGYESGNVLKDTGYWAAKETDRQGAWLQLALPKVERFDFIRLEEAIELGVRVDTFVLEIDAGGDWQEIARHTGIGHQRIVRLDQPVATDKIRLRTLSAAASPALSSFHLYLLPAIVEEPSIKRAADGTVTIESAEDSVEILYSLDGQAPSAVYSTPVSLGEGGTLKALARRGDNESAVVTVDFDVAPLNWKIIRANGEGSDAILSRYKGWNAAAFTGPPGQAVEIVLDVARSYKLKGFTLQPASQNPYGAGPPAAFTAWVSENLNDWGAPVAQDEFSNIAANRSEQYIRFETAKAGRYLKIRLPKAVNGLEVIAVGGIGIITR
ncbi:MAG: alpha-L-fucosidase [Exilibacterium sp.]